MAKRKVAKHLAGDYEALLRKSWDWAPVSSGAP
jgi:hypothetical protein